MSGTVIKVKAVLKSRQNKKAIYQSLCKSNDSTSWNDIKWNVDLESEAERDLNPDLDLNLRLLSKNVKSVVLDLEDFTKQLSP